MADYEKFSHGTPEFPIGVHDTHYSDGFWLYPHIHREFELLVLEEGTGTMFIDGCEQSVSAGEGVFVNSHFLHLGQKKDVSECRFFAIVFAPEAFGRFGSDAVTDKYVRPVMENKISLPVYFGREEVWQREVIDRARNIHRLNGEKPVGYEIMIKSELFAIWSLCFSHSSPCEKGKADSLKDMIAVMEYIRAEYASPLTLRDMAAKINMSEGHFCRKFSAAMHMSPFEFLLKIRIDNSCRLLLDTDLPIGDIAMRCGFNSFSYFGKKFRAATGLTPKEYRSR